MSLRNLSSFSLVSPQELSQGNLALQAIQINVKWSLLRVSQNDTGNKKLITLVKWNKLNICFLHTYTVMLRNAHGL